MAAPKGFHLVPASGLELRKYLNLVQRRFEAALVYNLEYLVVEMVNHAKLNAGYTDRTSNLKSSIGGVVLKNGVPITYKGFAREKAADVGVKTGTEFINSLISSHSKGYVILVVAGMEYASWVEDGGKTNRAPYNVLKLTEIKMEKELKKLVIRLSKSIK